MGRVAWVWGGQTLARNATTLRLSPKLRQTTKDLLDGRQKIITGKKFGDPRVVRYFTIEAGFQNVEHAFIALLEEQIVFFQSYFEVKIYQQDYPQLAVVGGSGGARLLPAAWPEQLSSASWYTVHRGISNDTGEAPLLYVNDTLRTTGLSWNYEEGRVDFSSSIPNPATDTVRAYYVWKPRVKLVRYESNPVAGKAHYANRYNPSVMLEQV